MTTTKTKMSKLARSYFLHAHDTNHDTGERVCYFSQRGYDDTGWGVWIDRHGNVDTDTESANGETPSGRLLAVLKIAARKHLA